MCKILAITNLKNVELDSKIMKNVRDIVCEWNKDGFGYALSDGINIKCEKFIKPDEFEEMSNIKFRSSMMDYPFLEETHRDYGSLKKRPISLIAHGRTSTNSVSVAACHPFLDDDNKPTKAFIHNGVISDENVHDFKLKTSNDTEILANVFWNFGVDGMEEITGYYATMNLFDDGRIHFVKDDMADLYFAYVLDIDSYIVATKKEMIEKLCELQDWENYMIKEIKPCVDFIVRENEIIEYSTFTKTKEDYNLNDDEKKAFKDYKDFNKKNDVPYYNDYNKKYDKSNPKRYW